MGKLRVTFGYQGRVTFRAGRSASEKAQWVPSTTDLELEILDAGEVERVADGTWRYMYGDDALPMDCRSAGGRTMVPFLTATGRHADGKDRRMDAVEFARRVGRADHPRLMFDQFDDPWPSGDGKPLPSNVTALVSDGRGAMEARIRARAGRLAVVDGIVYERDREPVLCLRPHGSEIVATVDDAPGPRSGYAFRLDRAEACREAYAAAVGTSVHKGGMALPELRHRVLDPGALRFREDVHNAGVAVRRTLAAAGEVLAWTPPDVIPLLHRLSLAGAGLADGTSTPDDVAGLLAELDAARESIPGRGLTLKAHVALARGVLESSLPTVRDGMDAGALSALGVR